MDVRWDEEQTPSPQEIPPLVRAGLRLLYDAYHYAAQLDHDVWDFAVEATCLRDAGLTNSELRWLVCKNYVEHAQEVTLPGEMLREFRGQGGITFSPQSCFILSPAGLEIATQLVHEAPALAPASAPPVQPAAPPQVHSTQPAYREADLQNGHGSEPIPHWDGARHQFRFNGVLIKEFKVQSPNQETILAAFQEEGWPPRIDDPLPLHAEIDPKRRLHDTIKSLNRNQKSRLVRFMGDGSGEAVRWELITPEKISRHAK